MVYTLRNAVYPFDQLRSEMDQLLTGCLGGRRTPGPNGGHYQLPLDVLETDQALVLEVEVPGVTIEQLDISVTGDELTLMAERPEVSREAATYHRRERPCGTFTRVVQLPQEVDASRIQAGLHDGVLTITLPKAEAAKPRKVTIQAR